MFDIDDTPSTGITGPAVDDLWRSEAPGMVRFATVLVGPTDAHDLAVDAFLRAAPFVIAGRADNPHAYLLRAVSNRAHDLRRSRERRWARELAAMPPASTAAHESNVDILRAISRLGLTQRAVVYFVYWEDLRERDVAEVLGISAGSVHRHLVRARTSLRKALS